MKFGVFYELQLPKPWGEDDERRLVHDALAQVELADDLGLDYAWAVEHHFLEEYSHCSASEVFLAAAAARTKRIRLGHGIRQVIANYNHPARTAEAVAMLDLVSNGRAELGIGEGATRLELGGFDVPAKEKRAMALEAAEQIANMMVMTPYPGYEGRSFKMPCRNVLPKPAQKPHPPMWMACSNRDTIKVAASNGLGALAFSFIDETEARTWSQIYYDIIKSDQCVPVGHSVNANIAMVSAFSLHPDREEAARRGMEGFEFFRFAISGLVTSDIVPGRSQPVRAVPEAARRRHARCQPGAHRKPGKSLSAVARHRHARRFQCARQIVRGGGCRPDHPVAAGRAQPARAHLRVAHALRCREVLPEFAEAAAEREQRKAAELAPYVEKRACTQEADAAARRRRHPGGAGFRGETDPQYVIQLR